MKENKRYIYLDILKIIACFFVIFNHTGKFGFFMFCDYDINSINFWCGLFLSIFSKFAVPIFLSVSGALLLQKEEEELKDIWKNRILKMIIILVVTTLVYYLFDLFLTGEHFSIKYFFAHLYKNDLNMHLWYLYVYIIFLITLPLLRSFVKNLKDKYFYYIFILSIIFSAVIPIIQYLLSYETNIMNNNLISNWLTDIVFIFPILGYFLHCRFDVEKHKKVIPIMWIINIITIIFCCYITYLKISRTGICLEAFSQDFFNSFVLINCSTIFITFKYIFIKFNSNKIIQSIANSTLLIYLLHKLIIDIFNINFNFEYNLCTNLLNSLLYCLVIYFVCFIISYFINIIFHKKKI